MVRFGWGPTTSLVTFPNSVLPDLYPRHPLLRIFSLTRQRHQHQQFAVRCRCNIGIRIRTGGVSCNVLDTLFMFLRVSTADSAQHVGRQVSGVGRSHWDLGMYLKQSPASGHMQEYSPQCHLSCSHLCGPEQLLQHL